MFNTPKDTSLANCCILVNSMMIIFLFSLPVPALLLVQCFTILDSITCNGTGSLGLTVPDMCCQTVADGGFGGQGYVNDTSGDCSLCSKLISKAE